MKTLNNDIHTWACCLNTLCRVILVFWAMQATICRCWIVTWFRSCPRATTTRRGTCTPCSPYTPASIYYKNIYVVHKYRYTTISQQCILLACHCHITDIIWKRSVLRNIWRRQSYSIAFSSWIRKCFLSVKSHLCLWMNMINWI